MSIQLTLSQREQVYVSTQKAPVPPKVLERKDGTGHCVCLFTVGDVDLYTTMLSCVTTADVVSTLTNMWCHGLGRDLTLRLYKDDGSVSFTFYQEPVV